MRPQQLSTVWALVGIAGGWAVSDLGYYLLLPVLGFRVGYNTEPVAMALYYACWVAIAAWLFRPLYRGWALYQNRLRTHASALAFFGGIALFAVYALPLLPSIVWTESWKAPELMLVTPWYFVPKSIEILFQQLLIAALVLTLAAEKYPIATISLACALLFGGAHILLAFGGMPFGYVVRFIVAAAAFGFVFPQLILRVPSGLFYSYAIHWLYYVVTIVMARTLSPYVA